MTNSIKFQSVVLVGAGLLAGRAMAATLQAEAANELTPQAIAAKVRGAYAALTSYSDSGKVVSELSTNKTSLTFKIQLQRTNLYRIDWTQETGLLNGVPPDNGVVWSDGNGNNFQTTANGLGKKSEPVTLPNLNGALAQAAGLSWSSAATIPGIFFNQNCGDVFVAPAITGDYPLKMEKDAMIDGVNCYVISTTVDLSKIPTAGKPGTVSATLWIGKKDFLIRQSRTRYVEKVDEKELSSDKMIDEASKKSLEMQNKPVTPEAIAAMRPQMKVIMKQVQSTLKTGFQEGIVMTQKHVNISVNRSFAPPDFAPSKL